MQLNTVPGPAALTQKNTVNITSKNNIQSSETTKLVSYEAVRFPKLRFKKIYQNRFLQKRTKVWEVSDMYRYGLGAAGPSFLLH
jgi:hypothetical protein